MELPGPDQTLYDLQGLIVAFAQVERNHQIPGLERRETDVEHSYSVAMLSWYVFDRVRPPLSLEKILKYALIHDMAEVHAGDVNSFADADARAAKVHAEAEAIEQIERDFPSFPEMTAAMRAYEALDDEEAVFVKTVDKIQSLVMDSLSEWRAHSSIEVGHEQFATWCQGRLDIASPYLAEIFSAVIEFSKATFWDQPESSV